MAWRRLARDAAAHLQRGVPRPFAPARTFPASCGPVANPTLLGRHGLHSVWSRYSSPTFQARAPKFGASSFLTARMPLGVRLQLPGLKVLKGFGTGTALAMTLYSRKVADAKEERPAERPSEDISGPLGYSKHELGELWSFVRKYQLPVGLIVLIAFGWRNPIGLVIHILLLLYSSRPNPYSIYLFLQEIHQREMRQNPAFWKGEIKCTHAVSVEVHHLKSYIDKHKTNGLTELLDYSFQTRKVDADDYKLFTIGTVELKDKTVLHVIGILGSWWIYHVSYVK